MVNSELAKVFPKEVMERRQMVSSGGKEAQINSWPTGPRQILKIEVNL